MRRRGPWRRRRRSSVPRDNPTGRPRNIDKKYLVYTKDCQSGSRSAWSSRKTDSEPLVTGIRRHAVIIVGCERGVRLAEGGPFAHRMASDLGFYRSTSRQRDHRERSRKPLWRKSPWVRIPLPPPCWQVRAPVRNMDRLGRTKPQSLQRSSARRLTARRLAGSSSATGWCRRGRREAALGVVAKVAVVEDAACRGVWLCAEGCKSLQGPPRQVPLLALAAGPTMKHATRSVRRTLVTARGGVFVCLVPAPSRRKMLRLLVDPGRPLAWQFAQRVKLRNAWNGEQSSDPLPRLDLGESIWRRLRSLNCISQRFVQWELISRQPQISCRPRSRRPGITCPRRFGSVMSYRRCPFASDTSRRALPRNT